VTIVYFDRVGLRAHLFPHKFEVLPKNSRPALKALHYLEKLRARGAEVRYVRPLWMIAEERKVKALMKEQQAEDFVADK
jgi:large subunit ribosomal protein L15